MMEDQEEMTVEDYRLILAINYFKLKDSFQKWKFAFIPYDMSMSLVGWGNEKDVFDRQRYDFSFGETYKEFSNVLSLDDFKQKILDLEEKEWCGELRNMIETYSIKHIYVYGYNNVIQRIIERIKERFSDINFYNIKDCLTSCTPETVDNRNFSSGGNSWRNNYYNNDVSVDETFYLINGMVRKIARIFVMGYKSEERNGRGSLTQPTHGSSLEFFYNNKKNIMNIANYISADIFCEVNTLSVLLLRRLLDFEFDPQFFSDIGRRSNDVLCLLKLIFLSLLKPNYVEWLPIDRLDILNFNILGPSKNYFVAYSMRSYLEGEMQFLEKFLYDNMNSFYNNNNNNNNDDEDQYPILYKDNSLYCNFIKFVYFSDYKDGKHV